MGCQICPKNEVHIILSDQSRPGIHIIHWSLFSSCVGVLLCPPPSSTCHTVARPCTTTSCGPTGGKRSYHRSTSLATASPVTPTGRSTNVLTCRAITDRDCNNYCLYRLPAKQLQKEAPFIYNVSTASVTNPLVMKRPLLFNILNDITDIGLLYGDPPSKIIS